MISEVAYEPTPIFVDQNLILDMFIVLSKEDNKSHLEINLRYPNKVFERDFCNGKFENTECLEKRQQYSHRSHIDSIDWQEIRAFK